MYIVLNARLSRTVEHPGDAVLLAREESKGPVGTCDVLHCGALLLTLADGRAVFRKTDAPSDFQRAWDEHALATEGVYAETDEWFFRTFPARVSVNWLGAALELAKRTGRFSAPTFDDALRFEQSARLLAQTCPQRFQGVARLAEQVGPLLEDLWVVEGRLQYPVRRRHARCGQYAVLAREGGTYCGECQTWVQEGDLLSIFN